MELKNPIIKKLVLYYKDISLLGKINATLGWDLNVNLPSKASKHRSEQSAYITELITNKWLNSEFRKLIEEANNQQSLTDQEKAILRNINYASKYYYKVPKELIIKKEKVTSGAFIDWRQAREENNFKKFQPHLSQIIDLDKKIAEFLGYNKNPYDALLDLYEPELSAAECERLFNGIKKDLVPLVRKILSSKKYNDKLVFLYKNNYYPIADQEKILKYITSKMGFDFQRGRIDVSAHPFTTQLGPNDIRLTTFYNNNDFRESFTSSMHEAGHALYEQGISSIYSFTPLEGGVSLGIHEALSRFWENMVGKNVNFLRFISPILQSFYQDQLKNISEEMLIYAFHQVKPSLIRIHADEVTYTLHIILRFEMESELINGRLAVKDAPDKWRSKSQELLGIEPKTDTEGILQDVHWAYGNFGYFPSYALGNLYGAQFLSSMQKKLNIEKELSIGNLKAIKQWLDKNVHQYGSLYFPKELIKKVSGKSLDYTYFVNYITNKYSTIYNL